MALKRFRINGSSIKSILDLADYFNQHVWSGHLWHGNLDAFNDLLRGDSGSPPEGFIIEWNNSRESRVNLGSELFDAPVEIIRKHGPDGDESEDNIHLELKE